MNNSNYEDLGFEVNYNLHPKFTVKSIGAGTFEGRSFNASLKISTRNISERLNQKTGAYDEIEEKIVFKFPCENDTQAGDLLDTFRRFRSSGEVIHLKGNLPNQNGEVLVLNNVMEFISKDIKDSKTKDVKK